MCAIQVGINTKLTYEVEILFAITKYLGVFECKNVLSVDVSCP